jgi:hypothetical protein
MNDKRRKGNGIDKPREIHIVDSVPDDGDYFFRGLQKPLTHPPLLFGDRPSARLA